MIEFTDAEKDLMARLSVKGGWDDPAASVVKKKIRRHLNECGIAFCCYCRVSMHGWHALTIDPEHILPKSIYPQHTFHLLNLNISCKRCNMGVKKTDDSFFLEAQNCSAPFRSDIYTIIHPNLDRVEDHLDIEIRQRNRNYIRKYWVVNNSAKGLKTYEYFKLIELEVESVDEAQGLQTVNSDLPTESADKLIEELKKQ
jgi:uncharacterized protein (TIGR02646 family)